MRRTTVVVVACALLATAGVWGAMMLRADAHHSAPSSSTRGPLTEEQYAAAVRVAQQEVDQQKPSRLTSATAVLKPGNVRRPNMADACHSGQVVKIRLVGRFPRIATGGLAGGGPQRGSGRVTLVGITTDATSGRACLLGVGTGRSAPYRDGADLMPALDR
jgi:hypothetical protein